MILRLAELLAPDLTTRQRMVHQAACDASGVHLLEREIVLTDGVPHVVRKTSTNLRTPSEG